MDAFQALLKLILDEKSLESIKARVGKEINVKVGTNTSKLKADVDKVATDLSRLSKVNTMQTWANNNSKAMKKYGAEISKLIADMGNMDKRLTIDQSNQITKRFKQIQAEARATGNIGKTAADKFKNAWEKFGGWGIATGVITKSVQTIKNMVSNVVELDNALLELSKVSDLSKSGLERITDEAYRLGEQVGRTGIEVTKAITEFKRAGYSMENSMGMAEAALVMTNVAEGIDDTADAAGTLISVLKGYDMAESEVMSIVDKINQVSNTSPIGFDQIAEGLERTSGTLAQSGTTIDETIGLITAGFAQLRNVEKVSTGLITLSARIRGVDEDGEVIDGLSATLQTEFGKIGVAIEDADGNLRSIYDIMQDYSKVLPTLTSKQKQYYAELAAGYSMINRVSSNVQKCA